MANDHPREWLGCGAFAFATGVGGVLYGMGPTDDSTGILFTADRVVTVGAICAGVGTGMILYGAYLLRRKRSGTKGD